MTRTKVRWRMRDVRSGGAAGTLGRSARRGFTLIELVVAMAILLTVLLGIMSSVAFAYNSSNDTELRNTAKNIAGYSLEYLRSRIVTRGTSTLYNQLKGAATSGTYVWYDSSGNATGALPGMVDITGLPLQPNGYPCNYTSTYVQTNSKVDGNRNPGSGGGISAGNSVFWFSSRHAASPTQTFSQQPLAFTTTLQGYASLRDVSTVSADQNPAPEDANLACLYKNTTGCPKGQYRTLLSNAWTSPAIVFPGQYPSGAVCIQSFTALSGYIPRVYTTDTAKTTTSNPEYNPYYTNSPSDRAGTQAYRGFRVLTQIVARTADPGTYIMVQYYDVTITVLWMNGNREASYELVSRLIAY
ncbi:MAG TPA: prepilin-type N-terminal cleavage/methylation domain-containing protein [Candidatus Cryosericum sp.]|nr:prepilin-type N-terminal cleavage/methylation domain-containing protein [Candidatus Cryosericum sp.]